MTFEKLSETIVDEISKEMLDLTLSDLQEKDNDVEYADARHVFYFVATNFGISKEEISKVLTGRTTTYDGWEPSLRNKSYLENIIERIIKHIETTYCPDEYILPSEHSKLPDTIKMTEAYNENGGVYSARVGLKKNALHGPIVIYNEYGNVEDTFYFINDTRVSRNTYETFIQHQDIKA